mgnify:FL=1
MTDQSLLQAAGAALREHGPTAAVTVLVGGAAALAAAVTRRAFTSEALLARVERELADERARIEAQRAGDRKADAERLKRIEADIAAIRSLMFQAFQARDN